MRLRDVPGAALRAYPRAPVAGDGNCFFRCVALGLYGDEDRHGDVRAKTARLAREAVANGEAGALFPLGNVYLGGERDDARALGPDEYIERHLSVPGTFSEEIDFVLVQRLVLDPLHVRACIFRGGAHCKTFGAVDLDEYNFVICIECLHDVHFNVIDVERKHFPGSRTPLRVLWNSLPVEFRKMIV
jgi:hypothetical protein